MSDPSAAPSHIQVSVKTIEQHFAGPLTFHLPWFQRAYAWGEDHAAQLLRDIIDATERPRRRYFLGNVMLAVKAPDTDALLVDGHQRTLTLTILLALLRDQILDPNLKARLDAMIRISPVTAGGPSGFRVTPQPMNEACFRDYVQTANATQVDPDDNLHGFLESERKFILNRTVMAEIINEHLPSQAEKQRLAFFLLECCHVVVHVVEDEDEAWEMLLVEESTGMPFHSSERSKIAMITVMDRDVQEEAGRTWDVWQARLGADGMARLLRHMRRMKVAKASIKPIEQDLVRIYELDGADLGFINDTLVHTAERYLAISDATVGEGAAREQITASLNMLKWLNREYWVPAALAWLEVHKADHEETPEFFWLTDRLAWLLRMAGRDPVEQERRFRRIATQIKSGAPLAEISQLEVEPKIKDLARDNLLSRTFYDKTYSRLVLRRLATLAGEDCGPIDGDTATVEHVLPRRPPPGSDWFEAFGNKKTVDQHAHRLGNLAILSFGHNQKAGGRPFPEKQAILAASDWTLSREFAEYDAWTPESIDARTRELAGRLFEFWKLKVSF